jgi:hypothetical protein
MDASRAKRKSQAVKAICQDTLILAKSCQVCCLFVAASQN